MRSSLSNQTSAGKQSRNAQGGYNPTNSNGPAGSVPPMESTIKCMTVVEEGSRIAFACYDEQQNEIILDESQTNDHDIEMIVQSFLSATRPTLILISAKLASNALLLDLITNLPSMDDNPPQDPRQNLRPTNSIPYQLLKSSAFDLRHCKSLILNKLRVMSLLHQQSRQSSNGYDMTSNFQNHATSMMQTKAIRPLRYNSLASIVDFDSSSLVRALGSLLTFLQNTTFRLEEGSTITIHAIKYCDCSKYMKIDPTTLKALHIFATEHHPLIAKGHGKEKEGYSLFTLLDRTKSKIGKRCLREWMSKPLLDPAEIRKRHDGIDLFLRPNFSSSVSKVMNFLQRVGAIDKILLRMQKCHSASMDFLILSRTLSAAVSIVTILGSDFRGQLLGTENEMDTQESIVVDETVRRELNFLEKILDRCHVSELQDLNERIISIIDQEATAEKKDSVVIHYGFHEDLDNAKEAFDVLDETLSAVGAQVLKSHPELGALKVVFLPQVGFLIALDKRNHSHNVATNEFPDLPKKFDYVFLQGNEAFFKNPDMRDLDNEIGDLDAFIKDTESMIVSELEEDILDCEIQLRSTFGALAELDCILALAGCAADLNFVKPVIIDSQLNASGSYFIKNGRHPLQELIIDGEFIANDTDIDESKRINVITGPNFSGKSCYTRQVGVLVYMAHIGSYLPCDQAHISITDQIMARISSVETCAVPQSSFQLDLTQMATLLRRSTPRTLCLIDEFGKGTAPISGIAVLTAALKKLSVIKCKVICTTHFLEIFSLNLLIDGRDGVKVLQMAVHIPDSDDDDAVPLFNLQQGLAKSSAGLVCAKMAGVHIDVVGRAREILGALKEGHTVKPIPAKLNSNSAFQPSAKAVLRHFLGVDSWIDESDEDIKELQNKIRLM